MIHFVDLTWYYPFQDSRKYFNKYTTFDSPGGHNSPSGNFEKFSLVKGQDGFELGTNGRKSREFVLLSKLFSSLKQTCKTL